MLGFAGADSCKFYQSESGASQTANQTPAALKQVFLHKNTLFMGKVRFQSSIRGGIARNAVNLRPTS